MCMNVVVFLTLQKYVSFNIAPFSSLSQSFLTGFNFWTFFYGYT